MTAAANAGAAPTARTPRYVEVSQALQARITSGAHPVGEPLPTEAELSRHFGVSRFTVREALRQLSELGLVERRQGARSTVVTSAAGSLYALAVASAEDLQRYASKTYLDIDERSVVEANGTTARFLRCRPGRRWRRLAGLRRDTGTGEPVGYTEVYLWAELDGELERGRPIFAQLQETSALEAVDIQQDISAVSLDATAAATLSAEVGAPALEVVRRYFASGGGAFEVARNVHPSGTFTYSLNFRRQAGERP